MTKDSHSRSKTRIQREKTEEILAAALQEFSQKGFRGSSINSISSKAGMSTPSLLYYFASKEDIHQELLKRTLLLWIGPLNMMTDSADPVGEICKYVTRKLEMSAQFPRESRLFANEILMGVPRAQQQIFEPLKSVVAAKIFLVEQWVKEGKINEVDGYHLFYSIWATTQHYADFSAQINVLSPHKLGSLYPDAEGFLVSMYKKFLTPDADEQGKAKG